MLLGEKTKAKSSLFKIDFDKVFDSINWKYLDSILMQIGYGFKWRMWINGCLSSSRASILVNGAPTMNFLFPKALGNTIHEDDLWKMYIQMFKISHNEKLYIPYFLCRRRLFVGEWSESNIKNLARILRFF